jgi:hypothetical protein
MVVGNLEIGRGPIALMLAAMLTLVVVASTPAAGASNDGALAWYERELIDLSDGWGGAQACHFGPDVTAPGTCFDSEDAMDSWLARNSASDPFGPAAAFSSCSSSLRLYDGTGYSGGSLNLTSRAVWLNLASYGFDQRTSSFKVGACASKFTKNANGGGAAYPLYLTEAFDQSSSMLSGWDNDVSSVYIY